MYFPDFEKLKEFSPFEGVKMKTASGDKIMMVLVDLDMNTIVPEHDHPHEQSGYVIEGELEFTVEGKTKNLRKGDVYLIPSEAKHSAKVIGKQPAKVLDVFNPPREDFQRS